MLQFEFAVIVVFRPSVFCPWHPLLCQVGTRRNGTKASLADVYGSHTLVMAISYADIAGCLNSKYKFLAEDSKCVEVLKRNEVKQLASDSLVLTASLAWSFVIFHPFIRYICRGLSDVISR